MTFTRLAPLYYTKVDAPFLFNLTPLEHQRKTLEEVERTMREKGTLAIINASVTGSGKTLANYAYSLLHKPTPTIGVYPTNELIRDQERALIDRGVAADELIRLDSLELDIWQQRMQERTHAQVLHAITGNWTEFKPVILTNPDILYLVMYNLYAYHRPFLAYRERVLQNIINNYPIIVFDEFHSYNVKQEANAAFIAATAARLAPDKPHIFIFSSATPDLSRLENYLRRVGIDICPVHTSPSTSGELVCEPIDIEILPADLSHWQGRETIEKEFGRVLNFLEKYPAGRGVFILDSVYEAKLLAQSLADRFGWDQVGELHGYLDADARRGALERRFTVGTTTIDVGVDFTGKQAKDFIVFEARSAEQFMQRLGRIGRQRRERHEVPNYALAVVPEYVSNALQEKYAALLQSSTCSREDFSAAIRDAFTSPNLFTGYLTKYAPLEATAAAKRILKQFATDVQPVYTDVLYRIVIDLFPRKNGSPFLIDSLSRRQWYTWESFGEQDKRDPWNIDGKLIPKGTTFFKELEQFRGSSDLPCAIYDRLDEARGFFPFKIYHFPFVARRTRFREIEEEAFLEHLKRFQERFPDKVDPFEKSLRKEQVLNYVVVSRLVEGTPQKLNFELDLGEVIDCTEQLHRFTSLRLHLQALPPCSVENANETIRKVNRETGWLGWVSQQSPYDLTRIHKLPPLFELFSLNVVGAGGGESTFWCLALGLSAIFMDSLPLRKNQFDRAKFA
jgi:CRISPR-associated endonuclease/helicase Cas3